MVAKQLELLVFEPKVRFSASKLSLYETCPRAYAYRYEERVRTPTNVRAAFGVVIHKMLEEFYLRNYRSKDTFVKSFRYQWGRAAGGENGRIGAISVWNEAERESILGQFYGVGTQILGRFWDTQQGKLSAGFRKPMGVEARFLQRRGKHEIIGVMDRLDYHGGRLFVGDYKTDRKLPTRDDLLLWNSHQFTIYHLALADALERLRSEPSQLHRIAGSASGNSAPPYRPRTLRGMARFVKSAPTRSAEQERKRMARPSAQLLQAVARTLEIDAGAEQGPVFYYHVRSGEKLPTLRSSKDFSSLDSKLDAAAEGIHEGRRSGQWPLRIGSHCYFCDYYPQCQKATVPREIRKEAGSADSLSTVPEGFCADEDTLIDMPY